MRMWEIRENASRYDDYDKSGSDYECGYEDGYEAAMKEIKKDRSSYRMPRRY